MEESSYLSLNIHKTHELIQHLSLHSVVFMIDVAIPKPFPVLPVAGGLIVEQNLLKSIFIEYVVMWRGDLRKYL